MDAVLVGRHERSLPLERRPVADRPVPDKPNLDAIAPSNRFLEPLPGYENYPLTVDRVAIGLYALDHGWAWGQDKLNTAEQLT